MNQYNALLSGHENDPRLASIVSPIKSNPQFTLSLDEEVTANSDDEKDAEWNSEDEEFAMNHLLNAGILSDDEDSNAGTPHSLHSLQRSNNISFPTLSGDADDSDAGMDL
jgi:hypothetical protein